MRSNTSSALKVLLMFVLVLGSAIFVLGQTPEGAEDDEVVAVPEHSMEQIVRRILIWSFKPRNRPTVIYLSGKGIKKEWLPSIKNIEFRVLTEEELQQRTEGVYFFAQLGFSDNAYDICFEFGDPGCDASGGYWHFRISNQKVKLWQSGRCGSGCGHGSGTSDGGGSSSCNGPLSSH